MRRGFIPVLLAVLLAGLIAAPAALAVTSRVRVVGASYQVLPPTTVHEGSPGGAIVDTGGTSYTTKSATALGATAAALNLGGLPWSMSIGSFGPYIDSIDGLAMAGDYSDWWELVVNGYAAPVGAGSLQTVAGDSYLWFQNPDATASKPAYLLVSEVTGGTAKLGFTPGQKVTVRTLGDDLSKVDSQADATRFSTTSVQTPAQFPAISGATVHVGSRVYSDAASTLTISDLAPGTYAVWVEKAMDSSVYAPSQAVLINVGPRPSLRALTAHRTHPRTIVVHVTLSERCVLRISAMRGGERLGVRSVTRNAGARTVTLHLGARVPRSSSVKVIVRARDRWARARVKTFVIARGH